MRLRSDGFQLLAQRVHAPDGPYGRQWLNPIATRTTLTPFRSEVLELDDLLVQPAEL